MGLLAEGTSTCANQHKDLHGSSACEEHNLIVIFDGVRRCVGRASATLTQRPAERCHQGWRRFAMTTHAVRLQAEVVRRHATATERPLGHPSRTTRVTRASARPYEGPQGCRESRSATHTVADEDEDADPKGTRALSTSMRREEQAVAAISRRARWIGRALGTSSAAGGATATAASAPRRCDSNTDEDAPHGTQEARQRHARRQNESMWVKSLQARPAPEAYGRCPSLPSCLSRASVLLSRFPPRYSWRSITRWESLLGAMPRVQQCVYIPSQQHHRCIVRRPHSHWLLAMYHSVRS